MLDYKTFNDQAQNMTQAYSPGEALALIKADVDDTWYRQLEVLSMLNQLQAAQNIAEARQICQDSMPCTFEFDDRIFSLEYNIFSQKIKVDSILESTYTTIGSIDLSINDIADVDWDYEYGDGKICDLQGNLMGYIEQSAESSRVLSNLASAAIMSTSDQASEVLNTFSSSVSGLSSQMSSSVSGLIDDINLQLVSSGGGKAGALAVFSNIYKNISNTSINDDGTIHFNNETFTVQGFAYSHIINGVVQAGSAILGTVLTVINPLLGIMSSLILSLMGSIFTASYLEKDTIPVVSKNSDNYLFAMPFAQGTVSTSATSFVNFLAAINASLNDFYNFIKDNGGVVTLKYGFCDLILWFNGTDSSQLFYEGYINAYVSYSGIWTDMASSCQVTKSDGKFSWSGSPKYTMNKDCDTPHAFSLWSSNCVKLQSNPDILNRLAVKELTPYSFIANLEDNITFLLCTIYGGGNNVTPNRTGTYEQKIAFVLDALYSSPDYQVIVEDVFPVTKDLFTAQFMIVPLIRYWFQNVNSCEYSTSVEDADYMIALNYALYDDAVSTSINTSIMPPLFGMPDRSELKVRPPQYGANAVKITQGITLGIALTATAVTIYHTAFRIMMKKTMAMKYFDVVDKQQAYLQNRTDDNFNKYWKSLKRYNLLANFTGYSKLSMVSGWETGDTSSTNLDVEALKTKFSTLTSSDTPSIDSYNLKDIINLIRP